MGSGVSQSWGKVGKTGISMQIGGLILESLADYQKGRFKRMEGNRNRWCNVGLWKHFTHPNYLGEVIFWVGTFTGGVTCNKTVPE